MVASRWNHGGVMVVSWWSHGGVGDLMYALIIIYNCSTMLYDVLLQLYSNFNGTSIKFI